ncbi:MAG TPA: acyl-CoA dehydratase activase [Gemmatimonadales bacterium]|nr:acyl-CoA dehydratase activase [Gemmatimonadales bacterium]
MADTDLRVAAGVDVGTECVKAVVVTDQGRVLGRAVVPTRGYFQACVVEATAAALDDAQQREGDLVSLGATGFGADCVPGATCTATDTACHALGAFHHLGHAMTLIDLGGRDPHVIKVDGQGRRLDTRSVRRCAVGAGSFLMFAARHLDVSPTRLEDLAAAAARPVPVSSYCSVFSTTEILQQLRRGATREEVALGCIHSIAERILEIGGFEDPVMVCGGVAEYFPAVLRTLQSLSGRTVQLVPEPILTGALGAALTALRQPLELEHSSALAAKP